MNNNNNFDQFDNFLINSQLHKSNETKMKELEEQRLMRKAYCKVNNIPFEEPQEIPGYSQGFLKVLVITIWVIIIATVICAFIGEGNFLTNIMKVWF